MRRKIMKNIILYISALLILFSCQARSESKTYDSYEEVFNFIADSETVVKDNIFNLASDSVIHRYFCESKTLQGWVIVIEANLYGLGLHNQVRGAQLNGRYYVFHVANDKFEYIGKLEGNMLKAYWEDGIPYFETSSHMSAYELHKYTYKFNGNSYERIKK
ncbi:MAG: hypothetical protein ABII27_04260 [bacterium]